MPVHIDRGTFVDIRPEGGLQLFLYCLCRALAITSSQQVKHMRTFNHPSANVRIAVPGCRD